MGSIRRSFVGRGLGVFLALPLFLATAFAGGSSAPSASEIIESRYSSMGELTLPGISLKNFGVMDGRIFRGAQPKGSDFGDLKAIGVNTIIDLREDSKKDSRATAEAAGLRYVNIPLVPKGTPTAQEAGAFLKAVNDPANGVVYVHCAGGRHRTGSMLAVYRMVNDGWTVDQAYDEMLKFDFYTSGGHKGYKTFVFDYAERMKANAPAAATSAL